VIAAVVAAMFVAVTARLFVFPAQGMPAHVGAVIMFAGIDDPGRVATALRLARDRRTPTLIISLGARQSGPTCPPAVDNAEVICFNPSPATTRGEAEYAGQLARQHHWKSVALVTVAPQITRARLRVSRCFPGKIYAVAAPLSAVQWPYTIAYEWGATLKALLFQRSC